MNFYYFYISSDLLYIVHFLTSRGYPLSPPRMGKLPFLRTPWACFYYWLLPSHWTSWGHLYDVYLCSPVPNVVLSKSWLWLSESLKWNRVSLASLVAQRLNHLPAVQETRIQSLSQEDPLKKEMATHSSILAWRIPWMEEPGRLQSMGSQRVGHNWVTSL